MKPIDKSIIKTTLRNYNTKNDPCTQYPSLMKQFINSIGNFFNYTKLHSKAYEVALWIKSNKNLLGNKGLCHTKFYSPKKILLVDLGNNTFGHEFSYEHPCIVLYNEYRRLFVVPCTSQPARRDINGNLFPENMEGTLADGFSKTSTVMLKEARFIDKTRVISELGQVCDPFYNDLYNRLFEMLFESKKFSIQKLYLNLSIAYEELDKIKKENVLLKQKLSVIELKKENVS